MSALTRSLPAFDPDSPDAEILEGFELVRTEKRWVYSFDGMPDHLRPHDEMERRDVVLQEAEQRVEGNFATTLSGVIARLTLALGHDQDRWADRCLAEHGLAALVKRIDNVRVEHHTVLNAAWELVNIEWEQALAAYESKQTAFNFILDGKAIVERAICGARSASDPVAKVLSDLDQYFDRAEDHFSDEPEIRRLIRTLTPDHAAYQRKVDIILAEGVTEDVAAWLARDTAFLVGAIEEGSK